MNCADYRRRLDADPGHLDSECEQHRAQCAECAAATIQAQGFEQRMLRALEIAPPAGLQQDLLQAIRQEHNGSNTALRHAPRARWMPAIGIAASLLLVVLAGFGTWSMRAARAMPQLAVQHVMGEEAAVLHKESLIRSRAVDAGFRSRQLVLRNAPPAGITYIHDCVVGGYPGVHLAMRRDHETVTVLYLLGTQRKAGDYQQGNMHVRMRPDARGTLVLLARNPAPFDTLEHDWQSILDNATTLPTSTS